ncbi:hypothetical protein [Vitiosangium sp. GDMCC 1.1324]|uniref:hypothetical protein n=1 Tax=Vitiosangium sp. (strain GDMCC 1.1324) TaxID=2138576 RepID=UPI0011B40876|nr:hypothetical protein [Vitiosangium sp. GDMCC 1.1324]
MGRSRLPLVAILSVVGCTKQDASSADGASPAAPTPPESQKNTRASPGEEAGKGASIRALTPEERENLMPRPIPAPENAAAQTAPATESPDASTPPDYAEQHRRQYERRYYGKGSGIQRSGLQLIRGTDGGTRATVKE